MKLDSKGFSLAEILVAILLTAIVSLGVISVALSSKQGGSIANNTLIGSDSSRRLADKLKQFVTADTSCAPITMGFCAPGNGGCQSNNSRCPGSIGWRMPGDSSGRNALDQGLHQINAAAIQQYHLLSPQMTALAFAGKASLSYCVGTPVGATGGPQLSSVTITVNWCPPGQLNCHATPPACP